MHGHTHTHTHREIINDEHSDQLINRTVNERADKSDKGKFKNK